MSSKKKTKLDSKKSGSLRNTAQSINTTSCKALKVKGNSKKSSNKKEAKLNNNVTLSNKDLSSKAKEFDSLVRGLLKESDKSKNLNNFLIFNYNEGFVLTDFEGLKKYAIKL